MSLKKLALIFFFMICATLVIAVYQYVRLSDRITYTDSTNGIMNELNDSILEMMLAGGEPTSSDPRAYIARWRMSKENIDRNIASLKESVGTEYSSDFERLGVISAALDSVINELSAYRGETRHALMAKMSSLTGEIYSSSSMLHSAIHRAHNDAVKSIFMQFQIILAVLAMLIMTMSLILWQRILKPLFTLARTMPENVSNGRYRGIVWRREDEVGTLVRSINQTFALLEDVNNSKRLFIAGMNHELKTPLNGIIGMSQSLIDSDLTAGQKKSIWIINQSAMSLLAILNDVLSVTKYSGNGIILSEHDISIAAVFNYLRDFFAESAESKGLNISFDTDVMMPEYLSGDVHHLRQVLTIIVGNAVKFTDSGSVRVSADLEKSDENEAVIRFAVADTGIGISGENIGKLFRYFSQLDNGNNRAREGMGLGLFIADRIVTLMGGSITVSSEVGKGTEFSLCLPLKIKHNGLEHAETDMILDTEQGLRRLSGNRALYDKLLATFVSAEQNRNAEFKHALAHNTGTALRIVHSLKGAAAGIGAVRLRNVSAKIETLLRSGSSVSGELASDFANTLLSTISAIHDALPQTKDSQHEREDNMDMPDGYSDLIRLI